MAAPAVQDLSQIMASLDPAYAGSRNLYNQQMAALPGQLQATNTAIETDKNNAFSDIAKSANTRGLDFFGVPLEEQSKYLGGTYLRSKNDAITANTNQQMTLQQALAQLEQDRYKTALGTQQGQQKAAQDWQNQQDQNAFTASQAALDRSASAAKTAAGNTDIKIVKNKNGGWDVLENGQKSANYDLATAAAATGKDLVSLLAQGDAKDRQAAKYYQDNVSQINRTGGGDSARAKAYALQQLMKDRSTAFYLGGSYGG